MVVDSDSVNASRGAVFVEMINRIYEMMKNDFNHLVNSMVMVISKARSDQTEE